MKKLSLVLALIFVLTCSLAACGGDETSTSSADATSSEAASSEAASSEAASSEEAVSSEEESSVEPVELGDNVALNKSWTISTTDGGTTTDPFNTENWNGNVTDGQVFENFDAATVWACGAWLGLHSSANKTDDGYAYITIDLGEVQNIAQVKAHLGNSSSLGIPSPSELFVMVSEDGEKFTPAGNLPITTNDELDEDGYWTELNLDASARYVQLKVFINGSWFFVNEIEVYVPAA